MSVVNSISSTSPSLPIHSTQVPKENRGSFWKEFMEEYFVDKATLIIETEISGQLEKFCKAGLYVLQPMVFPSGVRTAMCF